MQVIIIGVLLAVLASLSTLGVVVFHRRKRSPFISQVRTQIITPWTPHIHEKPVQEIDQNIFKHLQESTNENPGLGISYRSPRLIAAPIPAAIPYRPVHRSRSDPKRAVSTTFNAPVQRSISSEVRQQSDKATRDALAIDSYNRQLRTASNFNYEAWLTNVPNPMWNSAEEARDREERVARHVEVLRAKAEKSYQELVDLVAPVESNVQLAYDCSQESLDIVEATRVRLVDKETEAISTLRSQRTDVILESTQLSRPVAAHIPIPDTPSITVTRPISFIVPTPALESMMPSSMMLIRDPVEETFASNAAPMIITSDSAGLQKPRSITTSSVTTVSSAASTSNGVVSSSTSSNTAPRVIVLRHRQKRGVDVPAMPSLTSWTTLPRPATPEESQPLPPKETTFSSKRTSVAAGSRRVSAVLSPEAHSIACAFNGDTLNLKLRLPLVSVPNDDFQTTSTVNTPVIQERPRPPAVSPKPPQPPMAAKRRSRTSCLSPAAKSLVSAFDQMDLQLSFDLQLDEAAEDDLGDGESEEEEHVPVPVLSPNMHKRFFSSSSSQFISGHRSAPSGPFSFALRAAAQAATSPTISSCMSSPSLLHWSPCKEPLTPRFNHLREVLGGDDR